MLPIRDGCFLLWQLAFNNRTCRSPFAWPAINAPSSRQKSEFPNEFTNKMETSRRKWIYSWLHQNRMKMSSTMQQHAVTLSCSLYHYSFVFDSFQVCVWCGIRHLVGCQLEWEYERDTENRHAKINRLVCANKQTWQPPPKRCILYYMLAEPCHGMERVNRKSRQNEKSPERKWRCCAQPRLAASD